MGYRGFPKYVSVAEKKANASHALEKLKKKNPDIEPILIEGKTIAKNWWGKSWNLNLESYADYSNRIARGKSYLRNGSVLDLKISKGIVNAKVQGSTSKPYEVKITINALSSQNWAQVIELCNHRIDSLEQLLEGQFPKALAVLFTEKKYGLFPSTDEIHFDCSCPDWAYMCKHVAAVLYGIGAKLDQDPMLFFELRDLDGQALIRKSVESKLENMLKNAGKKSEREIADEDVSDLFGL
ncbi:SWIM zinc finger family protein [Fusibacter ferrireducens]|uniref:SWIM zinc finger family protein n=1 Tax=Fusibacter ferrireducens TaxID=2785058 RepID=A0ABR9ZWC5_9FIRM|nr:SWIM zinc finger family protein [Fusibacter ferrireducens]MBF4694656.1 SWIM zinc finger family protein [Fusibacter ferrireducens]